MRYLVNRKTKEHQRMPFDCLYAPLGWNVVQADDDGWIKHEGNECPLPDDVKCEYLMRSGRAGILIKGAGLLDWARSDALYSITHYRPILEPEKVQEQEPHPTEFQKSCVEAMQKRFYPEPTDRNNELLDRLKAAHEAQKELPKLLQELRDALGDDLINQLCAVPNSGFGVNVWNAAGKVDFSVVEHVDMTQPAEDMTDWRNWREGDLVECVEPINGLTIGAKYAIAESRADNKFVCVTDDRDKKCCYYLYRFRFHSRPAKGEK